MGDKTVATKVIESLRNIGVKHIFGVPSGGWVDFMEAIRKTEGIDFVLATHEGGAGFMADVCGRLTGVPGVCFGTFGPGATNLATGVGSANLDRSPLIALTDEMPESMRNRVTQMGIDHQALFAPITKMTTRLDVEGVEDTIARAAQCAREGRPGSVHIGMPVDVTGKIAITGPEQNTPVASKPVASRSALNKALEAFGKAQKPVLVLGLGAVRANIQDVIIRFAQDHQIPVLLTPMAKGMIAEDHPLYAGVLFHALSDQVAETHRQADLVIALGYDPVEFNLEAWMPQVPLINIDDEPLEIDRKEYQVTFDVCGDIAASFEDFSLAAQGTTDWDIAALQNRMAAIFSQMSPKNAEMGPCAVLDVLRKILPDDGIMACDVGAHTHLIGQKWLTPAPGTQLMTNGWSAMGFGLPAAIAAKLCRPEQHVCAVVGDGGFLMTAGELATAVREKLNIVVVVLTDNDLALIRIKQQRKGNPIFGTPVREKAGTIGGDNIFGAPVWVAPDVATLETLLERAFQTPGPVIVEAIVSSAEYDTLVLKKDKA